MAIEPKPLVTTEPVNIRVPQDDLEQLDAYCKFLGGATDRTYVIVEALRQVIAHDKRFRKARASRPAADSRRAHVMAYSSITNCGPGCSL